MELSINKLSFGVMIKHNSITKAQNDRQLLAKNNIASILVKDELSGNPNKYIVFTDKHIDTYKKFRTELYKTGDPELNRKVKRFKDSLAAISTLAKHEDEMIHYSAKEFLNK